MKAKELMIGDWVHSKSDNKNHKVNSIISQNDGRCWSFLFVFEHELHELNELNKRNYDLPIF